ncbi:MAG: Prolyl oligopeptidase [Rhodospirillales bacterium]|nr:Prolyl oligopeptidase [Rhodospirillales bacterium]
MRASILALALIALPAFAADGPPPTDKKPVTETVQGEAITDPYRWLENANSGASKKWVEAQANYTRGIIDKIPARAAIETRLTDLLRVGTLADVSPRGNYVFSRRREGTQNQPVLYVREGADGADKVLVDVNAESREGTVALDWFAPSYDGKLLAYGTSPNGSEISTLRVRDVATGKDRAEAITPARAANVAWLKDGSGFYYGRPKGGNVPQGQELFDVRIYFHKLGTNPSGDGDKLVFGEGLKLKQTQSPAAIVSDDDRWVALDVEDGWSRNDLWLAARKADGTLEKPVPVAVGKDALTHGFVHGGNLYILTNDGAPKWKLERAPVSDPSKRSVIVAESDDVLKDAQVIGGRLVLEWEHKATSRVAIASLDGTGVKDIQLPGLGTVASLAGTPTTPDAYLLFQSFVVPTIALRVTAATGEAKVWKTIDAPGVDTASYDVQQVTYPSKDGTPVSMFIVARKGTRLDGTNPVLLYGYGGFQVSMTPSFIKFLPAWLERGGVYALTNLRGGSEYGEAWHRAGMLDKKQNTFDDFIAAGEYLVRSKWTSPDKLAIFGGSNGGLLVGAAITQRPDLFRAAICAVPLLDMLRYQKFSIAKLWVPEYGSSDDPVQYKWLRAYSPYHNVKPGTLYPATMFVTGDTDTRVDPLHAKKMAALLQDVAANGKDPQRPILLRIEPKAGHGQGKPLSKTIGETADWVAFLVWQLGMEETRG